MTSRVRVFIAMSIDGFIAGPDDDLSWLPQGSTDLEPTTALGFGGFIAQVGALLMGRRTFDVVRSFRGSWPYGDRPVLVATRRDLPTRPQTVRRARGDSLAEMIDDAKGAAGDRDVYLDGGTVVREALDLGLVDEIIVTVVPMVLGEGVPLFAGAASRHALDFVSAVPAGGGMVEMTYVPKAVAAVNP